MTPVPSLLYNKRTGMQLGIEHDKDQHADGVVFVYPADIFKVDDELFTGYPGAWVPFGTVTRIYYDESAASVLLFDKNKKQPERIPATRHMR
jgi:hypothetical protein